MSTEQAPVAPDGICLADAWGYFADHSGRASDVNRQLAFAAIAIIWVFRGVEGSPLVIPDLLLWAGLFSALALGADLLHYLVASLCWGLYARGLERRNTRTDHRFKAPAVINVPAWIFFIGKVAGVAISYTLIAIFLIRSIMTPGVAA